MTCIEYITSEIHTHGFFDDNEKLQLESYNISNMLNIDDNQNKFYFYDNKDRIAKLNNGYYTSDQLAIELQRAINAVSGSQMYAVTVIHNRLKIEATHEFKIMMKSKHCDALRELTGFWSNTSNKNIHIGCPMCIDRKLMIIGRGKLKACFIIESGNRKDNNHTKVLYLTNSDSQPCIEIINLSGHHPVLDSITLNFKGLGSKWMTSSKYLGQINFINFDYGHIQFKS